MTPAPTVGTRALWLIAAVLVVATAWLVVTQNPAGPVRADPDAVLDPAVDGIALPDGYRPLLDRDQLEPVYDPTFTDVGGVDWPDDMLVIGVAGAETSKVYPVTHLNQHEMVIDYLEGEPILVSW